MCVEETTFKIIIINEITLYMKSIIRVKSLRGVRNFYKISYKLIEKIEHAPKKRAVSKEPNF